MSQTERISLGHGSGGRMGYRLITEEILPHFKNKTSHTALDAAILNVSGAELAFTTDSFVVTPYLFKGGNIGTLAVCGTVNDLTVSGAKPRYLSLSLILEEGFPKEDLHTILASIAEMEKVAGVEIVTGDTKVVERGSVDGIFINTAGIGTVHTHLNPESIEPGDVVIINGTIGDHGASILTLREQIQISSNFTSDCAPLNILMEPIFNDNIPIKMMRDPTRGGVASVLHEIANSQALTIELDEAQLPIIDGVKTLSELLGLDPLYMANEGKILVIVSPAHAPKILEHMKQHSLGKQAAIIGSVRSKGKGRVTIKTDFGTTRILDWLQSDPLPRIC